MGKLITENELVGVLKELPVVFTGGSFDLFHVGHADFLDKCKELGKTLIVLVASDETVKKTKGPNRPIIPENQRAKVLTYLSSVDYVFVSDTRIEDKKILDMIKPDILVLSDENVEEKMDYIEKSLGTVEKNKLVIKIMPNKYFADVGTSVVVDKIRNLK